MIPWFDWPLFNGLPAAIPWNAWPFHGLPGHSMDCLAIPWRTAWPFNGLPGHSKEDCLAIQSMAIQWIDWPFHGLLGHSMAIQWLFSPWLFNGLTGHSMDCLAIQWIAAWLFHAGLSLGHAMDCLLCK